MPNNINEPNRLKKGWYCQLKDVVHALCNAHHLRELKALAETGKEDWAKQMQRLLRLACHAANLAQASCGKKSRAGSAAPKAQRILPCCGRSSQPQKNRGWDVMRTLNQSPDTLLALLRAA